MLDVQKIIEESLFFEGPESLNKKLTPGERLLGSDMFVRVSSDMATIHYLSSSDQIEIPGSYLNLFQLLNVREGDRIHEVYESDLHEFIYYGIELPKILLYRGDSRGIRNIICKMVLLGTSKLRGILPNLKPWVLKNINSTIEV